MKSQLEKLLNNAYSPYSKIKVACIAKSKVGNSYHGVNVENAAFGSGICAERSAILNAVSNGVRKGEITELHLTSSAPSLLYPCGACRQVICEIMPRDGKIFVYFQNQVQQTSPEDLMPNSVQKEAFGWK